MNSCGKTKERYHGNICHARIRQAKVTHRDVANSGTIIDGALMEAVGLENYEQVMIYNTTRQSRWQTYAIVGTVGSGEIQVRGDIACRVNLGDMLTIECFRSGRELGIGETKAKIIDLDANNQIAYYHENIIESLSA